ncbi:MAG: energy transducer TonB [Pyrinomonadaceae bacterium]
MFTNLIESNSHKKELGRKGSFFLGTLAAYCLLLACAGLASIYAYDAHLDGQNMDAAVLVTPVLADSIQQIAPATRHNKTTIAETSDARRLTTVREAVATVESTYQTPKEIGLAASKLPSAPPNVIVKAKLSEQIGGFTGTPSFASNGVDNSAGNRRSIDNIEHETPPEPPRRSVPKAASKPPLMVSLGVINGKAVQKPVPTYPATAKLAHVSGTVVVQVLLSEEGKVMSAHALSGHPLLREAAVQAAYRATFSPTLLSNQPVKVSGAITYNFKLE